MSVVIEKKGSRYHDVAGEKRVHQPGAFVAGIQRPRAAVRPERLLPLLERLKFLAITGSNLDEFFMVRVGGLQLLSKKNNSKKDPSGMRPTEQLDAIFRRATRMAEDQYTCFSELEKQFAPAGIVRVLPHELSAEQSRHTDTFLKRDSPGAFAHDHCRLGAGAAACKPDAVHCRDTLPAGRLFCTKNRKAAC